MKNSLVIYSIKKVMQRKPYFMLSKIFILKKAALFFCLLMISTVAFSQVLPVTAPSTPVPHKVVKKKKNKVKQESLVPEETAVDSTEDVDTKAIDPNIPMKEFGDKAAAKTRELTEYISLISSNKTSRDVAYKSIDQACLLFATEDDRVEVSSINTKEKNKYKIRDYLNRLQIHGGLYDDIKIDYAKVSYASHFIKGTDGNYYANVTLEQTFKGYIDGKPVYADVTKKNITIVVKKLQKETEGGAVATWDVFLGDVGVVQTKKLKSN